MWMWSMRWVVIYLSLLIENSSRFLCTITQGFMCRILCIHFSQHVTNAEVQRPLYCTPLSEKIQFISLWLCWCKVPVYPVLDQYWALPCCHQHPTRLGKMERMPHMGIQYRRCFVIEVFQYYKKFTNMLLLPVEPQQIYAMSYNT